MTTRHAPRPAAILFMAALTVLFSLTLLPSDSAADGNGGLPIGQGDTLPGGHSAVPPPGDPESDGEAGSMSILTSLLLGILYL